MMNSVIIRANSYKQHSFRILGLQNLQSDAAVYIQTLGLDGEFLLSSAPLR